MKITESGRCALWLSGGKDSLLLLEVMMRFNLKFSILTFNGAFSSLQKKVFGALFDLKKILVYSYPPRAMTLVGDGGENISLVQLISVDKKGTVASLVSDFVPGTKCIHDVKIKMSEHAAPPAIFDAHIWGSKKSDAHWAGDPVEAEQWVTGDAKFYAPLFEWTDAEVIAALKNLGIDYKEPTEEENTGNTSVCHNCLLPSDKVFCPKENTEIPVIDWKPRENLESWKR